MESDILYTALAVCAWICWGVFVDDLVSKFTGEPITPKRSLVMLLIWPLYILGYICMVIVNMINKMINGR